MRVVYKPVSMKWRCMGGRVITGTLTIFLNTLLGCSAVNGSNIAKFCFAPYDDLIKAASQAPKPEERTRLYERAQVIFKQQAPWFTIAHATQFKATRADIVGYELSPMGLSEFFRVDVQKPVKP